VSSLLVQETMPDLSYSQPVRASISRFSTAMGKEKAQPWKDFWPLKAENYTAEQLEKMPWLTWKADPKRPDDRPWKQWMLANQSTVARRGTF
jgi:hypothetical protein